jgi:hypothetical protein
MRYQTAPRPESREFRASSVRLVSEHMFVAHPRDDIRRCGRCGRSKPLADFAWRRKGRGQLDNMCRPCRAAYKREHYLANKRRYVAQAGARKRALRRERTKYLLAFFRRHPCTDCGQTDPVVLDFDHVGPKSFDVSQALPYRSWQSILDEIAKCEVVCANCHRRRTARRSGALRFVMTQP